MSPSSCLALVAAFVITACASADAPPPVSPPPPAASAQPVPIAAVAEEPSATEAEAICAGTRPRPETSSHRNWPPPARATCCYPDKEGLRNVIRSKYPAMRRCYETALKKSRPDLKGRVAVKFIVQPDGTVPFACDSGSEVRDSEMLDCVLRAFLELRFPEQSGELCPKYMTVVYPIVFQPE